MNRSLNSLGDLWRTEYTYKAAMCMTIELVIQKINDFKETG